MAFRTKEFQTNDLEPDLTVVIKGDEWTVVKVADNGLVTIRNKHGREFEGRQDKWIVRTPIVPLPDDKPTAAQEQPDGYWTVQQYLLAIGLPEERLQTASGPFGKAAANLYRKRHGGKDAAFTKVREFVPWLGREFDSNAYGPDDLDILDAVREARLPAFRLVTVEEAIEVLRGASFDIEILMEGPRIEIHWLVEETIKEHLQRSDPCGHELCAKRRRENAKRAAVTPQPGGEDMFAGG